MKAKILGSTSLLVIAGISLVGCDTGSGNIIKEQQPTSTIIEENFTVYFENNYFYLRGVEDDYMSETSYPSSSTKLVKGDADSSSTLTRFGAPKECSNPVNWLLGEISEEDRPKQCVTYSYQLTLPTDDYDELVETVPQK